MSERKTFKKDDVKLTPELRRLDAHYVDSILKECRANIMQGKEFDKFKRYYKKFAMMFHKKYEDDLFSQMTEEDKLVSFREISRLFAHEEAAKEIMSKTRRVINFRIEDLKRETKDHKYTILTMLITQILEWNKHNKDQLEVFALTPLPNDLRQKLWSICLEDPPLADEYRRTLNKAKVLTISQFDVQIGQDCQEFVSKHMLTDGFDSKTMNIMRIILSYYEKKTDRILPDYLYLIAMPLLKVYSMSHYMMTPPSDLLGFYFSLAKIVKIYDPQADIVAQHDEKYDAMMTDLFMNSMARVDMEITERLMEFLDLEKPAQRSLLVSLVKRFAHSLGFEFLNLKITLFVWDQIIMRVYPMGIEIFIVMAISFLCYKENIMKANSWDEWVEFYYAKAKMIDFNPFVEIYSSKFKEIDYYNSSYKKPELSHMDLSVEEVEKDLNKSLVSDVSKKFAALTKKAPKTHSMLSMKSLKDEKKVNLSQVKMEDPELNYAVTQNIKMNISRDKDRMGIIPVDIDDGNDDGLFEDLNDDSDY